MKSLNTHSVFSLLFSTKPEKIKLYFIDLHCRSVMAALSSSRSLRSDSISSLIDLLSLTIEVKELLTCVMSFLFLSHDCLTTS